MSIPKEPRQLMINIMYLVLTALLALNVSAEIFNAFKVLDQGLVKSNMALDFTNAPMQEAIRAAAKAKPSLQTYADRVEPVRQDAKSLSDFIAGIKDSIISTSGGFVKDPNTQEWTDVLVGEKNIDATTRILVENRSRDGLKETKGEELKERLLQFKSKVIDYIDQTDRPNFQKEIAVSVDDKTWRDRGKLSWSHMNFDKMPVQAVIPMFNKYINDVKATEAAVLNYLGKKVGIGKEDIVLQEFTVVAAPEKSYIIKGEPYNADIFLTASAGNDSGAKVKLSVNGAPLQMDGQGRGRYSINTSVTGPKTYTATAQVYNPITETTANYTKEFTYEVGERSVAISPTKMNVFYIGVDNPLEISAAGANSNTLRASMSGAGGGTNFRVKKIPDPVPKLSNKKSGSMSSGEFKLQGGVFSVLENFDFETECPIAEFRLIRIPKRGDAGVVVNRGGRYSSETKALVDRASLGDSYYFENIKCKCPGDTRTRDLGAMVFKIK